MFGIEGLFPRYLKGHDVSLDYHGDTTFHDHSHLSVHTTVPLFPLITISLQLCVLLCCEIGTLVHPIVCLLAVEKYDLNLMFVLGPSR